MKNSEDSTESELIKLDGGYQIPFEIWNRLFEYVQTLKVERSVLAFDYLTFDLYFFYFFFLAINNLVLDGCGNCIIMDVEESLVMKWV